MADKEKLKKAVDKAKRNGFKSNINIDVVELDKLTLSNIEFDTYYEWSIKNLVFDHDFAKAFFGENWQYHLQQMVLEKDPASYLEQFVDV